ncbi:NB-ARC domain-containing protein [Streptosporangium subroseum]|uniref:NB-ARC domain-containing protein n=1 Tax=Streptosporangium subroseum TaxID=106412 RepID=A0A239EKH4_9ACTN|nr:NB-ARC domain-containing protein [Streptosporangium subroseum]
MTTEELAEASGVGAQLIGDLERGHSRLPQRRTPAALGLSQADEAALVAAAGSERVVQQPGPAQLPPDLPVFAGRHRELAEALRLLDERTEGGATVAISAIGGMAGVGKTTLAVHWAHQVAGRFPDGQLYVNLHGFDQGGSVLDPSVALSGFLEALGVAQVPESVEARSALFRSLLARRRMLVLLDNARDSEQVRPLLPGGPDCLTIVTSRNQLGGLVASEGAHLVSLEVWSGAEAQEALIRRLGPRRVAAEPEAVEQIIELCGRLPLAVSIVAARAAARPHLPLAGIAVELSSAGERLHALDLGEPRADVRAAFTASYRVLSLAAARLLRLLAIHPGPEISLASAASLLGVPHARARTVSQELCTASLLTEHAAGRYVMHDLIRAFATELLEQAGESALARQRLTEHYGHSARNAYLLYGRPPIAELEAPEEGITPEAFETIAAAGVWYRRERGTLTAVLRQAAAAGLDRAAALIVLDSRPMSAVSDIAADSLPHSQVALEAALRTGEAVLIAELERTVGAMWARMGNAAAESHFMRALELFRSAGDPEGESNTLRSMSKNARFSGNLGGAIEYLDQAIAVSERAGRPQLLVPVLAEKSYMLQGRDQMAEAIAEAERGLAIAEAKGMTYYQIYLLSALTSALVPLHRFGEAVEAGERVLHLLGDHTEFLLEFGLLPDLALAHLATGNRERAREFHDRWDTYLTGYDEDQITSMAGGPQVVADNLAVMAKVRIGLGIQTPGASVMARSLVDAAEPEVSDPLLRALVAEIQETARAQAGGSTAGLPALLLARARSYEHIDVRRRDKLLAAMEMVFLTRHVTRGVSPRKIAEEALALEPSVSGAEAAADLLLRGCATLIAVGYAEAVPILRAALEALAHPRMLENGVPEWYALGTVAARIVWDDAAQHELSRRVSFGAGRDGALDRLRAALITEQTASISAPSRPPGDGTAWDSLGMAGILAWQGDDDQTLKAAEHLDRMAEEFAGAAAGLAQTACTVLALGRGRYRDAFEAACQFCEQDVLNLDHYLLPDLIEAGVRCGERERALEALGLLETKAVVAGTPWALGLLARSQALLEEQAGAEELYLRAVRHLEGTRMTGDLARAHLVHGEWLRRRKRRNDARLSLRTAYEMFVEMGAAAFAERSRMELIATGERVPGWVAEEPGELTPQERRIAQLAAARATNQEIAEELFIRPSTVDYHLKKVFRKLGVTSRRQLKPGEL